MCNRNRITAMIIAQSISKHQATDISEWNIIKLEICSQKVNLWFISEMDLTQGNILSLLALRLSKVGLQVSGI